MKKSSLIFISLSALMFGCKGSTGGGGGGYSALSAEITTALETGLSDNESSLRLAEGSVASFGDAEIEIVKDAALAKLAEDGFASSSKIDEAMPSMVEGALEKIGTAFTDPLVRGRCSWSGCRSNGRFFRAKDGRDCGWNRCE